MKNFQLLLGICLFALLSCDKNQDTDAGPDYLIFGHYYGFCGGEKCIEIYKLEDTKLYEDSRDQYPTSASFYSGNFNALSNEKFELVKDIRNQIPNELILDSSKVIGIPDAGDWGGFYVEYKKGDLRKSWLLDKHKGNVPASYHAFMDHMDAKIKLLE